MISAEVALYPLKTDESSQIINDCIKTLKTEAVDYCVNSMNTHIIGEEKAVFNSLEKMFEQVNNMDTEASMVVTVTNAGGKKN